MLLLILENPIYSGILYVADRGYARIHEQLSGVGSSRKLSFRLAPFLESRAGVVWDTAQDRAGCTLRADARPDDHRAVPVRVHQRRDTRPTWQVHQAPEGFVLRPGLLASAIHGTPVDRG